MARIEPEFYSGYIYCPTVSTGSFVARKNGKIFITGNSGLDKSEILYGMGRSGGDSCVLVEAPLSVVMLDQHGVSNAVASFGCKLSHQQAKLLRSNYNNVLVFYDPDEAGQEGMRKAVEMLEDFMDVYVAPITRDDPAAMSLEENLSALQQAVPAWMLGVEGRR